jgi:hypothetical protein
MGFQPTPNARNPPQYFILRAAEYPLPAFAAALQGFTRSVQDGTKCRSVEDGTKCRGRYEVPLSVKVAVACSFVVIQEESASRLCCCTSRFHAQRRERHEVL